MEHQNELPAAVILSSHESVLGGCVLASTLEAGFEISAVIVARRRLRGGVGRSAKYLRRYGPLATYFRVIEDLGARLESRLRGRRRCPAIEEVAARHGLAIVWVPQLCGEPARQAIAAAQPGIGLLGGTGILAPSILELFPQGVYNAHPGILPKYRGNYANRWALLGNDVTGFSIYRVDAGIDTGPIVTTVQLRRRCLEGIYPFEERVINTAGSALPHLLRRHLLANGVERPQRIADGAPCGLMPMYYSFRLYGKLLLNDYKEIFFKRGR